jgi:hypothetical protein
MDVSGAHDAGLGTYTRCRAPRCALIDVHLTLWLIAIVAPLLMRLVA